MLTVADLKDALPPALRTAATQSLADMVNNVSTDPEAAVSIRENFLGFTGVLKEGRFKMEDYLSAVAYVSYKLMNYTNKESYKRTFPARYQALVARGATDKDISAYVSAYSKNKLVNIVMEQALVPSWVLNRDVFQKAIATQFELMIDPKVSPKVRSDAANSLMTHLKAPETKKVQLDISPTQTSGMEELNNMLLSLAHRSQELIAQGATTREIAHQDLGRSHTTPNQSEADEIEDAVLVNPQP